MHTVISRVKTKTLHTKGIKRKKSKDIKRITTKKYWIHSPKKEGRKEKQVKGWINRNQTTKTEGLNLNIATCTVPEMY